MSSNKDRQANFDHKLNNRFKMIDFFEQDESLVDARKEFREKLREFKKATEQEPDVRESCEVLIDTKDHQKLLKYEVIQDLGAGSFAKVKLAIDRETKTQVAIKVYQDWLNNTEALKKNIQTEVKILQQVQHPNIVKLIDWFEGKRFTYLVLEDAGRLSLLDYINTFEGEFIEESEAAYIFLRVAKALSYLHSKSLAHRDVKLDNIVLGMEGGVKLIDFGFGIKTKKVIKNEVPCGTPSYMAPELLAKLPHSAEKGDVWAYGVCLYRVLVGAFPFKGISAENLYYMIKKGQLTYPDRLSQQACSLISSLLAKKPDSRPAFDKVLTSEWFKRGAGMTPKFDNSK